MWFDESVFYQIYPLGALGAPFENDGVKENRIEKVQGWIEHLKKLGVSCILFNPVFLSSTHGYDTVDFFTIDNRLGTNEEFIETVKKLKENNIRVIYDAVFNHVGRNFPAFQDVLQNRENSRYKDWFHINFQGNNNHNDGLWYACWEGHEELVELNLKNPEVVSMLLSAVDFWMDDLLADGLRLDVAYHLDRDFLKTLHHHVKTRNPEFFLLGEMLHGDYKTTVNPEMLDSATNYECYKGLHSAINSANLFEISHSLQRQFGKEPWCLYTGLNMFSFCDNHDVTRAYSILQNKANLPVLYTLMMTMPGIPCIYYGSEWGMEGDKSKGDSDLRKEVEKPQWNELTDTIAALSKARSASKALSYGNYRQIQLSNQWCAFEREHQGERVWVLINISGNPQSIALMENVHVKNLLTEEEFDIYGSTEVQPHSALVLQVL